MVEAVVDASVWISALFRTEEQHADSRAWVDRWQAAGNGFVVPVTFLVEVGCAISRKHRQVLIASATVGQIGADTTFRLLPVAQVLAALAADVTARTPSF